MTSAVRLHNNSEEQYKRFHENVRTFGDDPITLDKTNDPVVIECGHLMDRLSFQNLANHANLANIPLRCPTCRAAVNVVVDGFEFNNAIYMIGKLEEENDLLIEENKELTEELIKTARYASRSIPERVFRGVAYYFNILDGLSAMRGLEESIQDANAWERQIYFGEWVVVPGQKNIEEEEHDARKT